MMHDSVATFYGGYDQIGFRRIPHLRVPWVAGAIGVTAIVLFGLVATDVSALVNPSVTIQVTGVNWYAEGGLLTTSPGFFLHASESITLTLTCSSVCFRFNGVASVSSPFSLVGVSVTYAPIQYSNVTVKAPSTAYDGPLTITLGVA